MRSVPNQFQDELEPLELLRQKQVSSENIQTYSDYFLGILGQMTDPPSIPRGCKMFEAQLLPEIRTRLSICNWDNLEALIAKVKCEMGGRLMSIIFWHRMLVFGALCVGS